MKIAIKEIGYMGLSNRILLAQYHEVKNQEMLNTHIKIGTGIDVSIKELAETIKEIVGFKGDLYFNTDKPDGTMKKLTDVSKLHGLGWKHCVELKNGIEKMYYWYKREYK